MVTLCHCCCDIEVYCTVQCYFGISNERILQSDIQYSNGIYYIYGIWIGYCYCYCCRVSPFFSIMEILYFCFGHKWMNVIRIRTFVKANYIRLFGIYAWTLNNSVRIWPMHHLHLCANLWIFSGLVLLHADILGDHFYFSVFRFICMHNAYIHYQTLVCMCQ